MPLLGPLGTPGGALGSFESEANDATATAGSVTLTLTPEAATATGDAIASAGSVALTLTPEAATVTGDADAAAGSVALTLTPEAPTVTGDALASAGNVELHLGVHEATPVAPGPTGTIAYGRRLPRFKLTIYDPLIGHETPRQSSSIDLNPDIESLTVTKTLGQGFEAIVAGYDKFIHFPNEMTPRHFRALQQPQYMKPFSHIVLTERDGVVAEARLQLAYRPAGRVNQFQAQGYGSTGLLDGVVRSEDKTTMYRSGELLSLVLRGQAPTIRIPTSPTFWQEPGVPMTLGQFDLLYPSEIKDQIVKAGDSQGNLLSFLVLQDRTATLLPLVPPARPDYIVDWDDTVTYQDLYDQTYGALYLQYTGGVSPEFKQASGDSVQYFERLADFKAKYGFMRTAHIQGGQMTDSQAQAFGQSWLKASAVGVVAAGLALGGQFYGDVQGLRLAAGGTRATWFVNPGEWVQIGDDDDAPILPIIRISQDCNSLAFTAQLGVPSVDWTNAVFNLRASSRSFRQLRSSDTGAKVF